MLHFTFIYGTESLMANDYLITVSSVMKEILPVKILTPNRFKAFLF